MDKKNISIGALILVLSMLGGYQLNDVLNGNVVLYECESRDILPMECDGFTKYVHEYGKCLNTKIGNKICRTGWVELSPYNEDSLQNEEYSIDNIGKEWLCSINGCVEKIYNIQ